MRAIPCFLLVAALVHCASAQVTYTRHEIGLAGDYVRDVHFLESNRGGVTGRYAYNLNSAIALESALTFVPWTPPFSVAVGGRELDWFTGVKAGVRRPRWGIFGKAQPGFRNFSEVYEHPTYSLTSRTHFALDLGGVFEFYPAKRWIVRADVSEVLTRIGDDQTRAGIAYTTPHIAAPIAVRVGANYRLGRLEEVPPSSSGRHASAEAGVQYGLSSIAYDQGFEMMDNSGLGAWGSYYFNRHVAIDASAMHFWSRTTIVTAQIGGSFWQMVAGPKIGITREKFGVYAKVRPGIVRFANAVNDIPAFATTGRFQPVTQLAIDMGGVLEFYPKRHWVIRMDFSDVTIHYGSRTSIYPAPETPFRWPAYWQTTLQTGFGFGWRF